MKKGLSILLIAAALFGFYGGAVNLQDVLACMKYWEKEGERSTADMNKLEDGLKQLQDNEQAYLDGKDQLAEGEKALADAEIQLAEGRATLAKGEADYKAAPAKLAAGEEALEDGYSDFSDLKRLISGLNVARAHGTKTTGKHDTYWHDGYAHKASKADYSDAGLLQARQVITTTINGKADQMALIGSMVGDPNIISNINSKASYAQFDKNVLKLVKAFKAASDQLKTFAKLANSYASNEDLTTAYKILTNDTAARAAADAKADEIVNTVVKNTGYPKETVIAILSDPEKAPDSLKEAAKNYCALKSAAGPSIIRAGARQGVQSAMVTAKGQLGDNLTLVKGLSEALYTNLVSSMTTLISNSGDDSAYAAAIVTLQKSLETLGTTLNSLAAELDANAKTLNSWDKGYNTLLDGQKTLGSTSSGIPYAFNQMLTNKTIKAALKQYDPGLRSMLKKYTGGTLKGEDLDDFDDDLTYISKKIIPRALSVLAKVRSSAVKQLADGEKQLAQGKKDYAAAPAKLAAGRKALADGEAQYADGIQQLEDGKKQLAQYEDGEQQVRDGLATLMSTEPSGGLESILDRRNGDDDFDNGDEHLDLAEGLDAVDVGRGYQADSGDLITAELVKRGAGTAAGIAAGVLALLAALLSFLKRNKGAAISGCIAAIAAAGGAAVGTSAGTEFSAQAGSTVGMLPWAAAGALAAIAVVFAIVHFSNPKEATK